MDTDPEQLLMKWFVDSSWLSCKVEKNSLKIRKINEKKLDNLHDSETERAKAELATFAWLNNINKRCKDLSIVIPLTDGEQFCTETDVTKIRWNFDVSEELVVLETDLRDGIDCEYNEDEREKVLPLFISIILCSKEHENGLILDSIIFKHVSIYGTIVGTNISNSNNILLVDDGTGEITCCIDDYVNGDLDHEDNDNEDNNGNNLEGELSEITQIFRKKTKLYKYCLPVFDQIKLGDRVYISGRVSLYKGKHYLFVKNIERSKDINNHINFMNDVFNFFEMFHHDIGLFKCP